MCVCVWNRDATRALPTQHLPDASIDPSIVRLLDRSSSIFVFALGVAFASNSSDGFISISIASASLNTLLFIANANANFSLKRFKRFVNDIRALRSLFRADALLGVSPL